MKTIKKILLNIYYFFTKLFTKDSTEYELPYIIQYENNTNETKDAVLFGFHDYLQDGNFGNGDLRVTNIQGGFEKGYTRLVNQSVTKTFRIKKMRFHSRDVEFLNELAFTYNKKDANGCEYSRTFYLKKLKHINQDKETAINLDIDNQISIDASTCILFKMKANTTLVISIYPSFPSLKKHTKRDRFYITEKI